jgi:hypothetical protein
MLLLLWRLWWFWYVLLNHAEVKVRKGGKKRRKEERVRVMIDLH